jgi:cell division transport system permease protein
MKNIATALTTVRRSPYQSFAAILLLTVTFFVGYSFSLFTLGSEQVLKYFETRPQVIGFFEVDATESEIQSTYEEIREKEYVDEVTLVTKQDALLLYQEENREDPLLLELVTAQILPASLEISGETINDLQRIRDELETQPGVDEVVLQDDVLEALASWTTSIRLVGAAAIGVLAFTSLLIMIIIIGMKVVTKRPAILIMRIIGASNWFVKSPFMFEGMFYGLVSSTLGWISTYAALLYITPWLREFLGPIPVFPIPLEVFAVQFAIGTTVALFLGAVAGSIAVSRVMKK